MQPGPPQGRLWPFYEDGITIICGDVREQLPNLAPASAHCCVTSPPYWGLRDYGVEGQIGLEATPEEYVAHLVEVFREVRHVLRDDGTLWLNLGDCYATGAGKVGECPGGGEQGKRWKGKGYRGTRQSGKHEYISSAMGPVIQPNRMPIAGLKPKDLVGIPWRVAFALQTDGWYLRSDIIWHKPNPMPESMTDRPTKAHEYLFLLAKSGRYYYDSEAIAEPCGGFNGSTFTKGKTADARRHLAAIGRGERMEPTERNKRSVWTIATQPYPEAHFATFPEDLIKPCILAGCPLSGVVLDPFGGSGTTMQVARFLGRQGAMIELNESYCELAVKRLSQGVLNL